LPPSALVRLPLALAAAYLHAARRRYYDEKKAEAGDEDNGEPPKYVLEPACIGQLGAFRAWFGLLFLLIFM